MRVESPTRLLLGQVNGNTHEPLCPDFRSVLSALQFPGTSSGSDRCRSSRSGHHVQRESPQLHPPSCRKSGLLSLSCLLFARECRSDNAETNSSTVTIKSRSSFRSCFFHDFDNRVFHFLCHVFQLLLIKHRQQSRGLQRRQYGFTTLLLNRDPAGQSGRDAHVCIEHLFGLLRLTDLNDQAFPGELDALLHHLLLEIVNLHDTEVIRQHCNLQGHRRITHCFDRGYCDQHCLLSCITEASHGPAKSAALFPGKLVERRSRREGPHLR